MGHRDFAILLTPLSGDWTMSNLELELIRIRPKFLIESLKMDTQLELDKAENSAEADSGSNVPGRVRSFCLVPASSGIRSFRLAPHPFMNRHPVSPDRSVDSSTGKVRSFRLAETSKKVRSFWLASGS